MEHFKTVTLHESDCHELLPTLPDKYFDLAICDPPYGTRDDRVSVGKMGNASFVSKFTPKSWDFQPFDRSFFEQIFRVSKFWILWGAQHYADNIPPPHKHSCEIIWDKKVSGNFADTENAWTNFPTSNALFVFAWNGFRQGKLAGDSPNKETRLHPTQKPIALYEWILAKYAKHGYKILDPTAGAGACGIACIRAGLECTLIENDAEYCGFIRDRLNTELVKPMLFTQTEIQNQIWG